MVTRDQFREAAATHALFRRCGCTPDAARTAKQAAQALAEALSELNLPRGGRRGAARQLKRCSVATPLRSASAQAA